MRLNRTTEISHAVKLDRIRGNLWKTPSKLSEIFVEGLECLLFTKRNLLTVVISHSFRNFRDAIHADHSIEKLNNFNKCDRFVDVTDICHRVFRV